MADIFFLQTSGHVPDVKVVHHTEFIDAHVFLDGRVPTHCQRLHLYVMCTKVRQATVSAGGNLFDRRKEEAPLVIKIGPVTHSLQATPQYICFLIHNITSNSIPVLFHVCPVMNENSLNTLAGHAPENKMEANSRNFQTAFLLITSWIAQVLQQSHSTVRNIPSDCTNILVSVNHVSHTSESS